MEDQCSQCRSSSRLPTSEVSESSGEYSFYKGKKKCYRCPLGAMCHDGVSIETGWGWWISKGTDLTKSKLRGLYFHNLQNNISIHENSNLCPWMTMSTNNKNLTLQTIKPKMESYDVKNINYNNYNRVPNL